MTINGINFSITPTVLCNNGSIEKYFTGAAPNGWSLGAIGSSSGLLTLSDINYEGAFRVDGNTYGESGVYYNDMFHLAVNNQNGNLFINGNDTDFSQKVGEINIPTLSTSSTLTDLNIATNTQPFVDVFDQVPARTVDADDGNGISIYGIYEYNGDVIFNYALYYDAAGPYHSQTTFIKQNTDLDASTNDVIGVFELSCGAMGSGWISPIPVEWQSALGGDHITGWSAGVTRAVLSRLSCGPSAFAFNIADLVAPPANEAVIPTTELMSFTYPNIMGGYTGDIADYLLGSGRIWNNTSTVDYGFIVPNTDTYICFGRQAGYNSGLSYKLRNNTSQTDWGDYDAVDPTDYRSIYMMFDVNDFVRVKNGEINGYDIEPYEWGTFNPHFGGSGTTGIKPICGATFDPVTGRLYMSILGADNTQGVSGNQPIIEVYTFGGGN